MLALCVRLTQEEGSVQIKKSTTAKWLIFLGSGLRGQDLNLRPSGYEPDELPDCSTPRRRNETINNPLVEGNTILNFFNDSP